MSNYIKQEFDFVERTKEIFESYKNDTKYDITLLINCCVGLLIVPQQYWYKKLPKEIINENKWGISTKHIKFITKGEYKNVKNVARHLRNSISHYRFSAFAITGDKIDKIKFIDKNKDHKKTFEAEIPVKSLEKFILTFSQVLLEEMRREIQ